MDDSLFRVKQRKAVPYEFVLDAIAPLSPRTHPMFGCLAVYVKEKIVLILRDKLRLNRSRLYQGHSLLSSAHRSRVHVVKLSIYP